jgi:hypothetical protein
LKISSRLKVIFKLSYSSCMQSITDPAAVLHAPSQVQSTAVAVGAGHAAMATCADAKAVMPLELLFTPPSMDYVNRQRKHQGLDGAFFVTVRAQASP